MSYYFSKVLPTSFDEALQKVTDALTEKGMGVMTEIDVDKAFKKKLDVDFRRYKILGACHAPTAYKILQADDKGGALFPCNVVVQELEPGRVEVSAVNPTAMFQPIDHPDAKQVAAEAAEMVRSVIDSLA
ncbi:DUF302 domain-containing protein [Geitlerinema sp. PCC 9228]|jgi:uncharacterized protein (DUF302 family)|uniref:DUF302 domain-containing protein n=1 Tax=Geitlerinema sp. PCC 9228 TaxID=111611 RepID=UPI0008F9CBB9|nr:DUF302 domain-containing protein [Geitlerinema sp. PCC 9228]